MKKGSYGKITAFHVNTDLGLFTLRLSQAVVSKNIVQQERIDEFAIDPIHKSSISDKTNQDAETGSAADPSRKLAKMKSIEYLHQNVLLHKEWLDSNGTSGSPLSLEDCDFLEANLSNHDLREVAFRCVNFDHGNFTNTDLYKAILCGSSFNSACFNEANLQKANFDSACMAKALLTNIKAARASFAEANLLGVNFQNADLRKAFFYGADLREASFQGANVSDANFQGAKLSLDTLDGAIGIELAKGLTW